jgi:hypothetical protein
VTDGYLDVRCEQLAAVRKDAGMSLLQELADRLRDDIVTRYALTEVGDPYEPLVLASSGEQVGAVRVWTGPQIPTFIDSRLVIPAMGVDSTQFHAFAASDTAVPHLGSDVAGIEGRLSFNVDLTPRVDLAVEPAYLDGVYAPLSDARAAAYAMAGAVPVDLPLRLLAVSSPWITGVTVGEDAVPEIEKVYRVYIERFYDLIDHGVPALSTEVDLVERDRAHRRAQFDPASDAVWDFLAGLLGQSSIDAILALVRTPGPPPARV